MGSQKQATNKTAGVLKKILKPLIFWFCKLLPCRFKKVETASINSKKQIDFDKKLVFSFSKARIPSWRQFKYIKKFLSTKELWLIRVNIGVIILSVLFSAFYFYFNNLQVVPISGGTYIEGLIGSPQHINPLYASASDVDNDLTRLVYSSLFAGGKNGELIKDLVENYEISDDSKIYTFTLIPGALWHDGSQVTIDDVIFTFNAIKDGLYKSPLKNSFAGVEIERLNDNKFRFLLSDPYAAFLELLTFGIIPADIWAQVPPESAPLAQLNLKPIGSGPYKFKQLAKDAAGNVREYELEVNQEYYGSRSFINLKFIFYPNFEEAVSALNNNIIEGISYMPQELKDQVQTPKAYNFYKLYLPQLTLIFLNQDKNPALADKAVRQALAFAIDRNTIINTILNGGAYSVDSPILANSFAYNNEIKKYNYNQTKAGELLESLDWKLKEIAKEDIDQAEELIAQENLEPEKKQAAETTIAMGQGKWRKKNNNYLLINIKTVDRKDNNEILELIKKGWEAVGIKTVIEILPVRRVQEVIKARDFDAMFYGLVVGSDPDPYVFWHSSQTGENGFNIANFSNKEVDQLLEDARLNSDQSVRKEKYNRFQEIISEEVPAIFLYSPIYTYVQSNDVKGFDVKNIHYPRDRFTNINEWYIKTGKKLILPGEDD